MTAVALGIGAAACWGLADFMGGISARRLTIATVLLVSQLTALAAIAVLVLGASIETAPLTDVAPALAAGACQLFGIAALYRALAIGTMSVISPISASGAAALPVIVGLAAGERPGGLAFAGMAAAFAGVVLAPRSTAGPAGGSSRQALLLSAVAAIGFGGFFVGMDAAVDDAGPFWALFAARLSAGAILVVVLLALRPGIGATRADLPALALIGLLDVSANACFTLGTETGLLSVVSVLASLYPVATVLLARVVLRERLGPIQAVGVATALGGVAMIAAG